MLDYQYRTARLSLIPFTIPLLESLKQGPNAFLELTSFHLPEPFTEFPESMDYTIDSLKKSQVILPWTSFAVVLNSAQTYVGQCGFKTPPDENGAVELGYEIAEAYRHQGLANEVIIELIDLAFSHTEIRQIAAHTLPEKNISNHLLLKHGFIFEMAMEDETDGTVWKWILSRQVYQLRKLMKSD